MRPRSRVTTCLRLLALVAAGALPVSCAAPVVVATGGLSVLQAGTAAFINGELEAAIPKPLPVVYDAADQAIRQLQFTISAAKLGEVNGYIYATQVQGRRIEITCEEKTPVVTKVSIRVGVFGDQPLARLILATLQSKLSPGASTTDQSASILTP
jgi:hypothetical protein